MRSIIALVAAASVFAGLSGCGPSHSRAPVVQTAPMPVSHTVFAPYVNDVNKAKNVQNVVNAQKQALDQAIRKQADAETSTPAPGAQSP